MEQTNNSFAASGANTTEKNNLKFYNLLKSVPQNAKKPIKDGRLAGKTDINPMWRIKILTETFGPFGIGWKYVITNKWLEKANNDTVAAFVDLDLYIKDPETGQWSEAIPGNGGNVFMRKESSGKYYVDDDCYKKAISDALGSAAKLLGVAAEVYWETDTTKYSSDSSKGSSGNGKGQSGSPSVSLPKLTPDSPYWNKSVATAMNTTDNMATIRERISKKFTITDKDFMELMKAAGKLAA